MIYLDYSATTPVNSEVLDTFVTVSNRFIGNSNSLHKLGTDSKHLMNEATKQITSLLHVKPNEIIYTSGSSESNNLAIKGIIGAYPKRGKHIITTKLEHSSILEPLHYLEQCGYQIDYVNITEEGLIDLEHLKTLLTDDTILVSIASVSSELGLLQPIDEIGTIVKQYPKCFFHSDMTQSMGKIDVSLTNVDLISFSAHKFYGIKGIGCLIKKEKIELLPLIHGGESTTIYRSGTPAVPLIASMAKALRIALSNLSEKQSKVLEYSNDLKKKLLEIPEITLNSTSHSIPHILNFSVVGIKPETLLHALESHEIYLSTKSACSSHSSESMSVMALTNDKARAISSLRVSISHLTTMEELETFLSVLQTEIEHLTIKE